MDNNKENLNKKTNDFSEDDIDDDFDAMLQNENNSVFDDKQEKIKTKKVIGNKDKKFMHCRVQTEGACCVQGLVFV